jgi:hypothetical protein
MTLDHAIEEISYHATSGIKHPPAGSLLEACSARPAGVDAFDSTRRIGLMHVAFPMGTSPQVTFCIPWRRPSSSIPMRTRTPNWSPSRSPSG